MNTNREHMARYLRVRRFFVRIMLHALWWDVLLNRPLLRWCRRSPQQRWRRIARHYRRLALEMGGVLIKLGQFLSIRVDLLPVEITDELGGLQDEVPPVPIDAIRDRILADFGRAPESLFKHLNPEPLGAASLAQVHQAELPDGRPVVVKVLRPGIESTVATDLAAIAMAVKWLKRYRPLRRWLDLDWLLREFSAVTRKELDLQAEGRHIERFKADFSEHDDVYLPQVFWDYSARCVLTMENVYYFKIDALDSLRRCGIDPRQVADRLYRLYMQQVFETHFVHVDPHPGNLFVVPLPTEAERAQGIQGFLPGEAVDRCPQREFKLAFVDFGMVALIPERLRSALREYAIGLGTRDARRIVKSYISAGVLLPEADLARIEEAHVHLFNRFWGVRVADLRDVALDQAQDFLKEYRDVIQGAPFQFQADLLFILRAIGILAGLATTLDPDFDVWSKTIPFGRRYAKEQLANNRQQWRQELEAAGQTVVGMPVRLERLLSDLEHGRLTLQTRMASDSRQFFERVYAAVARLGWFILAVGCLLAWSRLIAAGMDGPLPAALAIAAGVTFLLGLRRR